VVEGGSLENYCGSDATGGSNPSLSAKSPAIAGLFSLGKDLPKLFEPGESGVLSILQGTAPIR
jgi:hypothetical protein